MKAIKVSEIQKDIKREPVIFLRNFKKMSYTHAYKPCITIDHGTDKGSLLICRYKGCGQKVLSPDTTVYSPKIEDIK